MIYLGADHRGFEKKEQLKEYFEEKGYEFSDLGTASREPVDYPLIAEAVAQEVVKNPDNRGILLCGSGAGVCIAANKVKGVRAAQAWNEEIARLARNDDDINVLCLAADYLDFSIMQKLASIFLETPFEAVERRTRRLKQIKKIERA